MNSRKKWRISVFSVCNGVIMALCCMAVIIPYWDLVMRSISGQKGAGSLSTMFFPKGFTLGTYMYLFKDDSMIRAFLVTISRTVAGTMLSLVLTMLAAYPLSKRDLPLRNLFTIVFLIPMFFSGGLIPSYLLNRSLGLVNNFLVYILPGAVGVYNTILCRNYLMSIDKALEESAFIDGAGYGMLLARIVTPLCKPILATLALFFAVGQWNAWFDSMIYAQSENLVVLQLKLRRMMDLTSMLEEDIALYMEMNNISNITTQSMRAATTVVTILPIVCVYPFIQQYFVKGIMVGSLKG